MNTKVKSAAMALGAAALAATGLSATATTASAKNKHLTGEQQLAKLLEGRKAGEPRNCIFTSANHGLRVIDDTALVYKRGKTLWVSTPTDPESLDHDDVLVIRRSGSQLCRLDMITTMDRFSGIYTGNVQLGKFVPYTKE